MSSTYRAVLLTRRGSPKALDVLADKKIDPLVCTTFPLLEARKALELLASGSVAGRIVLEVPVA